MSGAIYRTFGVTFPSCAPLPVPGHDWNTPDSSNHRLEPEQIARIVGRPPGLRQLRSGEAGR